MSEKVSMEEIGTRALRVATKKPLTAAQIAAKMTKNHKAKKFTARGIGRGLARLVAHGVLIKNEKDRPPTYQKP